MKVIVAGFSRTGTMSTQVALDKLGYRTYHMFEAIKNQEKGHLDMWNAFMEGKNSMDWEKLFEGYDASTDLPACIYWREMMVAFPDAKVILTIRDAESWWKSYQSLVESQQGPVDHLLFLPRFKKLDRLVENNEHNEAVKTTVPADRLLIFDVKDGWEPLCKFLGVPTPDEPFPHENIGTKLVEKTMGQIVIKDLVKFGLPYLVGTIIVVLIIIYLLRL
jgi:hypothetical protein